MTAHLSLRVAIKEQPVTNALRLGDLVQYLAPARTLCAVYTHESYYQMQASELGAEDPHTCSKDKYDSWGCQTLGKSHFSASTAEQFYSFYTGRYICPHLLHSSSSCPPLALWNEGKCQSYLLHHPKHGEFASWWSKWVVIFVCLQKNCWGWIKCINVALYNHWDQFSLHYQWLKRHANWCLPWAGKNNSR